MIRSPRGSAPKPSLHSLIQGSDVPWLANLLAPFFLPAAAGALIGPNTAAAAVQDAATIALGTGGLLNWSFKKHFTVPPAVTATPEGTGSGQIYVDSVVTSGCVVKSTDTADRRTIHLSAIQPSQGD